MRKLIKNGTTYVNGVEEKNDILIDNGMIEEIASDISADDCELIDCTGMLVTAGFVDVHVHLREPGFSYKSTIENGTMAAARGGYTAVCSMPNLNPPPDSKENLQKQLDIIYDTAAIKVYPLGCITMGQSGGGELTDMEKLKIAGAIAFSDDGRGVQNERDMLLAMEKAVATNSIICAHCEDESLLFGGYIHEGEYAKVNGHKGICSASEWKQIERDIKLVEKTGCKYHVCHISTKESVELIRQAKAKGLPVTCETAPHYLLLCDMDIKEEGRFKMNPPIRSDEDRQALIAGVQDGTIDVIATDHAPHSMEEKSKGLKDSAMGVVGIETAFPVLYENLVKTGVITLARLLEMLTVRPREIFGIAGGLHRGAPADIAVIDLGKSYKIDSSKFISVAKATPLDGMQACGEVVMTMLDGEIIEL